MNYYKVYGLICKSAIKIDSFQSVAPSKVIKEDFSVELGKVVREFPQNEKTEGYNIFLDRNLYFLHIPDVAKYYIENNNKVIIEPLTDKFNDVLLHFRSSCLAAILVQKGKIPFHVSGVADELGNCWLFAGDPGAGKSTTALKLSEKGYRIFTDDTALIYVENGTCFARPSFPLLKVWPTTFKQQRLFEGNQAFQYASDINKFGIYFHSTFNDFPLRVKGITFLSISGKDIWIKQLKPVESIKYLVENNYADSYLEKLNMQADLFKLVTSIAGTTNFWLANRPDKKSSFDSFAEQIKKEILLSNNTQTNNPSLMAS
ncbi:hypothetical protein [Shivajiella indica]|uniref:Serine kinase n=1 Tax=Shivajiella indica TaxID=872115 RepID=A0ABW5B6H2_9BACT